MIFLGVAQTCDYMGVHFLDFLRSRKQDVYGFARKFRRGRKAQNAVSSGFDAKSSHAKHGGPQILQECSPGT
jgi:hypothetical protein